jgi:hypothetical protein
MLNHQTIEKLYTMRMRGMADAFTQQQEDPQSTQLSFEERFALLVDGQWNWRQNRVLERRLGEGCKVQRVWKTSTSVRRVDWTKQVGPIADERLGLGAAPSTHIPGGADRDWENVSGEGLRTEGLPRRIHRLLRHCRAVVSGAGVGSSGRQLCQAAPRSGTSGCADCLRLGDGAPWPKERRAFLEICDERYLTRSTLLTSQLPVAKWHAQIGDPTVADSHRGRQHPGSSGACSTPDRTIGRIDAVKEG